MNQLYVPARRSPLRLRFFLKGVEHVDRLRMPNCVNSAESIASMVFDNFNHSRPTETNEYLCVPMLATSLRDE